MGLDVKYGVTQNLVADLTVNTDFAQVEADEQQVNLTRFSLFFPEKREFFLENQGLFTLVARVRNRSEGLANTPILFYSRGIGLQEGREVQMLLGGRLTGRVGKFSLGVMNVQTDDEPVAGALATNFSVVRGEAGSAPAEQHRRALHRAVGVHAGRRVEPDLRC